MQTMDPMRLCVRLDGRADCQTPHLIADVLGALKAHGDDVRVTSVSADTTTLVVNSQEVTLRAQTKSDDRWYSVTANGKAVCLTPFRTDAVTTHVTYGDQAFPIVDALYHMWAKGIFPKDRDELLQGVGALYGTTPPTSCLTTPVTYVETKTFVEAIHLILEATSVA